MDDDDEDIFKDMKIKKRVQVDKKNDPDPVPVPQEKTEEPKISAKEEAKKKRKSVFDDDEEEGEEKPKKEKEPSKPKPKSKSKFYDDEEDDGHKNGKDSKNDGSKPKEDLQSRVVEEKFMDAHENYDNKLELGNKMVRENLATIEMRHYHNWIKAVLINKYSFELKKYFRKYFNREADLSVLDIGCGFGGDLMKWRSAKYYLGTDISKASLESALTRWQEIRGNKFSANFIRCSAGVNESIFFRNIPKELYFDIVTSQFAVHYLFKEENTAENLFRNIAKKLCKNGYFVCTIPDSEVMVKRLRTYGKKNEKGEVVLGNKFYSIKFPSDQFPSDKPYGIEYGFFLDDGAVGSKIIDEEGNIKITYVPEYLIVWDKFMELAQKNDLELVEEMNFHKFCKESIENRYYYELMARMKIDDITKIPKELWEISFLYKIVVLRKTKGEDFERVNRAFDKFEQGKVIDTEEVNIPVESSESSDTEEGEIDINQSDLAIGRNQSTMSGLFD